MSPEVQTTRNPSGTCATESPCVSSTSVEEPRPEKMAQSSSIATANWPSSRLAFFSTVPPWA
eukprot:1063887-Prymnesium_polylepis.2